MIILGRVGETQIFYYLGVMPKLPVSKQGLRFLGLLAVFTMVGCHRQVRLEQPPTPAFLQDDSDRTASPSSSLPSTEIQKGNAVSIDAMRMVGVPYRYGGSSPHSGFDCSGLVAYVYRDALNITVPRTAHQLATMPGIPVKPTVGQLLPGDLVFFGKPGKKRRAQARVTHVGIYIGDGRFIHAPASGRQVRTDYLSNIYWQKRLRLAKRIIGFNLSPWRSAPSSMHLLQIKDSPALAWISPTNHDAQCLSPAFLQKHKNL